MYMDIRADTAKCFQYTLMCIATFDFILLRVGHRPEKKATHFRQPSFRGRTPYCNIEICLPRISLLALHFGHLLLMPHGRVNSKCHRNADMNFDFLPVPRKEQLHGVIGEYYRVWNPQKCFGSLDGKHCEIKCPPNSGLSYYNYFKYVSIVLQGLADARKKFVAIEVGSKGRRSDGGIFSSSVLFKTLEENQYLMLSLLIKRSFLKSTYFTAISCSYSYCCSKIFNNWLSSVRKCVECAFGILHEKWGIFSKPIETSYGSAYITIHVACLLHNIVREMNGNQDQLDDHKADEEIDNRRHMKSTRRAELRRVATKFLYLTAGGQYGQFNLRSEGAIGVTLTRTHSASSLLRAKSAVFPP
ncbi:hypothetical protein PR048_014741 [Dryococelus australis]|uniref:DDE Tnp4 domain-containing protein n=1 Tax=Dryococelus australis TaxID=614101 RepID=A0ABQ9HF88_9NEOP|nr:hypothetical protein PR048_014741 [Dryococelus australis]